MSEPHPDVALLNKLTPTAAGKHFGISRNAVSMWKRRGRIPPEHHLAAWLLALEIGDPWEPAHAAEIRARLAANVSLAV